MKKTNKKGFTLVELVIVVAVMAVLVAVAIPTVASITKSADDAVADTNCRTIESMIKLAEANLSKDGDGIVVMDKQDVAVALYEAKLGIDEGTFYYIVATGECTTANPAEVGEDETAPNADTYFVINFTNMQYGEYKAAAGNAAASWTDGKNNNVDAPFVTGGPTKPAKTN